MLLPGLPLLHLDWNRTKISLLQTSTVFAMSSAFCWHDDAILSLGTFLDIYQTDFLQFNRGFGFGQDTIGRTVPKH
jgi:hypothetical protein